MRELQAEAKLSKHGDPRGLRKDFGPQLLHNFFHTRSVNDSVQGFEEGYVEGRTKSTMRTS